MQLQPEDRLEPASYELKWCGTAQCSALEAGIFTWAETLAVTKHIEFDSDIDTNESNFWKVSIWICRKKQQ